MNIFEIFMSDFMSHLLNLLIFVQLSIFTLKL